MFKSLLIRFAVWRLHRELDKLEARFLSVRADMFRREVN